MAGKEDGRQVRVQGPGSIYELQPLWYQGWYFHLRLEEEMARCQRYGYPVSLLVIRLQENPAHKGQGWRGEFEDRLRTIAARKLRRPDLPAILGEQELAACLPHTDRPGAEVVAERLARELRAYRPSIGMATAPEEARTAGALYARASQLALGLSGRLSA